MPSRMPEGCIRAVCPTDRLDHGPGVHWVTLTVLMVNDPAFEPGLVRHPGVSSAGAMRAAARPGTGYVTVGPDETRSATARRAAPPLEGVWLADPKPHRPRRSAGQRARTVGRGLGSLAGLAALLVG